MDKYDVFVLIVVLFAIAIVAVPIIWEHKSEAEANANKYCFEKYQNLEDIKTCKEIFYK